MKRDIKFRAWNTEERRFHGPETLKSIRQPKFTSFYGEWKDNVMVFQQYTGLNDKNGKEIYEGDILKSNKSDFYNHGYYTDVYFLYGAFVVSILYDQTPLQLHDFEKVYKPTNYPNDVDKCEWLEEFEVIGNIYEHPELLK